MPEVRWIGMLGFGGFGDMENTAQKIDDVFTALQEAEIRFRPYHARQLLDLGSQETPDWKASDQSIDRTTHEVSQAQDASQSATEQRP